MLSQFLKWSLVFILTGIIWCDTCEPEFRSNLRDTLLLKYDINRLDVTKMILRLVDNQPFLELFTGSCRELVKTLRVDYRVVGELNWIRYVGRRGSIDSSKKTIDIKDIDPCSEYEIKFIAIANDDTEHETPHIQFGPFYRELNHQEIKLLNYKSMPDISHSITYTNISHLGFTVSWTKICAQGINVFLLSAPNFKYQHPYRVLSNLLENNEESSLWISTDSCQEYKVTIESFMTKEPIPEDEIVDESRDHVSLSTVITDPDTSDLISIFMDEGSLVLTWKLIQQIPCLSEFSYLIYLTGQTGDLHVLQKGDWKEKSGSLDLMLDTYAECSMHQIEMKVSYQTNSSHYFEEIVFSKELRTNHVGKFAIEGIIDMHIIDDNVHVTFDTCNKEALLCLIDNEAIVMNITVTADMPNIPIKSFTNVTENCVKYILSLRNGETDNVFTEEAFPTKQPKREIKFQMTDFTTSSLDFKVLGIEENYRCPVNDYIVRCSQQAEYTDEHNNMSEFHDGIDAFQSNEGSGILEKDIHDLHRDNITAAFIAVSRNESNIEIEHLESKTMYKCEATIQYDVLGNIESINSSLIYAETEGFDGLNITQDGTIIVTCDSRIEELQLALVFDDGYIMETMDANCTDPGHIDMFINKTEECIEYSIELYEAKELDKFVLNYNYTNSSLLMPIDIVKLPDVKGPQVVPELQFLYSHNTSVTFNIITQHGHHCKVKFYCVTCSNGEEKRGKHHSIEPQVTVKGLVRGDTYNCSAHVEYQRMGIASNVTQEWIRYSPSIEVQTEGFDEMEMLDDGNVLVTCGSNLKQLNIALVEVGGKRIATKEASCNDSTRIDEFRANMKPCGEYKIELITKKEYEELIEQENWEDGGVTVLDEVLFDIKQPEGHPEVKFVTSYADSVKLEIVDEINYFCKVETIEVQCGGVVNDTHMKINKVPSSDGLMIPSTVVISGLSPENSYTCSAIVQYSQIDQNRTELVQYLNNSSGYRGYNPISNLLSVKTSIQIPIVPEAKGNSNTIIYIIVGTGVILGIIILIFICKRRKSGGKDLVESANENRVQRKDSEKATEITNVEVEVAT